MPLYTAEELAAEAARRRRRRQVSPFDAVTQGIDEVGGTIGRIAHVEEMSGSTLPTGVTLALADSKLRERELRRASALLARRFDVQPQWLFHKVQAPEPRVFAKEGLPWGLYRDPSSGGLLTLETARRIIKPFEPSIIQKMLVGVAHQTGQPDQLTTNPEMFPKLRHIATDLHVPASRIADVMQALGPLPGQGLELHEALGAAVQVARSHVDVAAFGRNVRMLSGVSGLRPLQVIAGANVAAANGIELQSVQDAAKFIAPPEAQQAISAAERRRDEVVHQAINQAGEGASAGLDLAKPADRQEYFRRLHQYVPQQAEMVRLELGVDPVAAMGRRLLHSITGTEEDYVTTARRVVKEMHLQQDAFQHSILGHVIGGIGKAIDYAFRPIEVGGEFLVASAQIIGGSKEYRWSDFVKDAKDTMAGRTSFGQRELVDHWHLPGWTASVGDLALGFAVAPDVLLGRALAERVAGRTLAGVVAERGPVAWQDLATDFLTKPHRLLTKGQTFPEFFARAAWDSKTAEDYYLALDRVNVGRFGAAGLSPTVASQVYFHAQELKRAGRPLAQLENDVGTVLGHAFGAKVPVGSLAARIDEEQQNLTRVYQDLLDPSELGRMGTVPSEATTKAIEDTRQVLGRLSEWDTAVATGRLPLVLELPHYSPLRSITLGLRKGAADLPVARGLRRLLNHPPDNMMVWDVPGSDPVGYLRRWSVASAKFPQAEIDADSLTLGQLLASGDASRELKITSFLESRNRRMIERVAGDYGLTKEQADTILQGVNGVTRRQLFGVKPSVTEEQLGQLAGMGLKPQDVPLEVLRGPTFETQLANQFTMIDPVHARYALSNAVGMYRTFRARLLRALGHEVTTELPRIRLSGLSLGGFLREFQHDLTHGLFLSWWKPLVVLRPAYLWRVPLGDENLRFLATAGLMGRLESTEHGARLLDRVDELAGRGPETLAVRYGPSAGETIEFARPGHLQDEMLQTLAGTGGFYDLARFGGDDFHRAVDSVARRLRRGSGGLNYGMVRPEDPGFTDQWLHSLQAQVGLSAHGQRILTDIAAGRSEQEIVRRTMDFLQGPGRHVADRMLGTGWSPERLELLVRQAVGMTRYYTGAAAGWEGAGRVAMAARDGSLSRDLLQGIPTEARPAEIHGFDTAMAFASDNVLKRGIDRIYAAILQAPTNVINRHPFARLWRDRAERGMLKVLNESGVPITPALRRNVIQQANEFALTQVRRILFDFRDTARYMDMVSFVAPFFQPFTEAFVSWGRIIRQNPAVLGYARLAGQAMEESGFVRRDPDTGELVVPMSNFLGAAPLLAAVTGVKGWEISNALSSWNLFLSTTFPAPFPGVTGGFPIPVPGLSPPALLGLQRLLESDAVPLSPGLRTKLSSWAFEFGPEKFPQAFLPVWLNRAISAAYPKWLESETNSQVTEFLRIQEMLGMNITPDQPPPGVSGDQWKGMTPGRRQQVWEAYRVQTARSQASKFAGLRALYSLVFPGAPRITYPTAALEDEFRRLSDRLGYDKGRDEFMRRHPDLWSITIPKTMWSKANDSPVPIPSNQFVEEILRNPDVQKFAQKDPAMVWALIPREIREAGKLDIGSFFSQIARGDRVSLSPEQFLHSEEIQKGWEAYFTHYNAWSAWQDAHPNLNEGDAAFDFRKSQFDEAVNHTALIYPTWYRGDPSLGQDGYVGFQQQRVDPNVMRMARALATDNLFLQTDAGQGLAAYMKLRDRLLGIMRKQNITSIDTKYAGEAQATTVRLGQEPTKLYVADAALRPHVAEAVKLWNRSIGAQVLRLTDSPEGALPVRVTPQGTESFFHSAGAKDPDGFYLLIPQQQRGANGVYMAQGDFSTPAIAHELGHAMGLVHPEDINPKTGVGSGLMGRGSDVPIQSEIAGVRQTFGAKVQRETLKQTLADGLKDIFRAHPDFEIAYNIFFQNDLHGVPTYRERLLGKMDPQQRGDFIAREERWKALREKPFKTAGLQQQEAWLELRQFTDRMFTDHKAEDNPILVGWRSMRPDEQGDYKRSLVNRPYIYWSRFDRGTVAGEKTDAQSEAIWNGLERVYLEIARRKEADPNLSTADLYNAVDRQVRVYMQKDPTFAAQVKHSNDWGWRFETLAPEFANPKNPARPFWNAFLDAIRKVETVVNDKQIHGEKEWDPGKRAYYFRLEHALSAYQRTLAEQSADFRRQWNRLEQDNGLDDFLHAFVPQDWWFPTGGFEVT